MLAWLASHPNISMARRTNMGRYFQNMKDFSLVYIIGAYPGLTTTFIDREIQALRSKGVQVRILSIRRPHTPLSPAQKELQKITRYLLPVSLIRFIVSYFRFAVQDPAVYFGTLLEMFTSPHPDFRARLKTILHFAEGVYAAELIRERRCSHIHAHFVDRASSVALVAGRLLNIPYSVTAHANDIYVKPVLLDLKLSQASFVATCSAYDRSHLARAVKLNGRLHCFYHGLELDQYQPQDRITSDVPVITAVGQLKEKKGFTYLIEACRIMRDKGCVFQCHIIGDGILRENLEQQIHELSLESYVTLCGPLSHEAVVCELKSSTLFVLPCITGLDGDRDGIPNAILEAMAMKLPIVSTAHSGIPEAVKNQANGLLVPPGDSPSLANAMIRLLGDPALRARMGERGRQTVREQFDAARNADRLLAEMVKA